MGVCLLFFFFAPVFPVQIILLTILDALDNIVKLSYVEWSCHFNCIEELESLQIML